MKQVYEARDSMEAHFIRQALEAEQIDAVVQGENLAVVQGLIPETTPSVWVNDADIDRAMEVISRLPKGQEAVSHPAGWKCPKCGETVEGQFDVCWNCGETRPQAV